MRTREEVADTLLRYRSDYDAEHQFVPQFTSLLGHKRSFCRDHLPGHITASSWIIDETHRFSLLTHHAKLNRWLQPGGHADGDEDIVRVAFREAMEETGLSSLHLLMDSIFDIDIHPIPARSDFPAHRHYDIRFLFQASREEGLIVTHESKDLAWAREPELSALTGGNPSIMRMAEKVRKLF